MVWENLSNSSSKATAGTSPAQLLISRRDESCANHTDAFQVTNINLTDMLVTPNQVSNLTERSS